jgi:hypothetical protein
MPSSTTNSGNAAAVILDTLREAIQCIENPPDELAEPSSAANNLCDPDQPKNLDQPSDLVE